MSQMNRNDPTRRAIEQEDFNRRFQELAARRRLQFGGDGAGGPAAAPVSYNPRTALDRVRPNMSAIEDRPQPTQIDPAAVRSRQNQLLVQQRAVDQQIRALRRQRVQGGTLTPEQIQQLAQLESQAVSLRQNKVDAFRLGNELEGRGPASPSEAQASRMRLARQVEEARRGVRAQAQSELDNRFATQARREVAGIPDYRPEGMPDREADRLYQELSGTSPSEARQRFLLATDNNGISPEDRSARSARMARLMEEEQQRQLRSARERGVEGAELDAALDARETRAQIAAIEAQNDVQRSRNAGRAAEVESRGLELAGRRFDQEIERIDQLGDAELQRAAAEINQAIAEAQSATALALDEASPEGMEMRRRMQALQAELQAVQLEEAVRRVRTGPEIAGEDRSMLVNGIAQSFAAINGEPIRGDRIAQLGALSSAVDQLKRLPNKGQQEEIAQEVLRQIAVLTGAEGVEDSSVPFTYVGNFIKSLTPADLFAGDGLFSGVRTPEGVQKMRRRRAEQERVFNDLKRMAGLEAASEEG